MASFSRSAAALIILFTTCSINAADESLAWTNIRSAQFGHLLEAPIDTVRKLADSFMADVQSQSSQSIERPQLVFAYFSDVQNSANDDPALQLLETAAESAVSVKLPAVNVDLDSDEASLEESLIKSHQELFPDAQLAVLGNCHVMPDGALVLDSADGIQDFMKESGELNPHLLLLCTPSALESAYQAVVDSGINFVALHGPNPQLSRSTFRRSLLADTTTTTSENADSFAKAIVIEIIFVAIVLLVTLLSGLSCLMAIDSPTRFEAPRDA